LADGVDEPDLVRDVEPTATRCMSKFANGMRKWANPKLNVTSAEPASTAVAEVAPG